MMAVPDVLRRPRHGRAGAGPPSKPSTPSRCWTPPHQRGREPHRRSFARPL